MAKKQNWPSPEELKSVMKKLDKVEGTLMLPEHPTAIQKFRWDICQQFIKLMRAQKLKQVDLAYMLDIDKSEVHRILHHRIDGFSTDRLLEYLSILKSDLKLKVS